MRKAHEIMQAVMYSSLSHQVVAEMCLEIAKHMYKAATLAGNVAEEIIIAQVVDTYVWKLYVYR